MFTYTLNITNYIDKYDNPITKVVMKRIHVGIAPRRLSIPTRWYTACPRKKRYWQKEFVF